jgi:hypothetical protein
MEVEEKAERKRKEGQRQGTSMSNREEPSRHCFQCNVRGPEDTYESLRRVHDEGESKESD